MANSLSLSITTKKTISSYLKAISSYLNPIQDGLFQDCSWMEGEGETNICHTYPTAMKLGSYTLPKEDP